MNEFDDTWKLQTQNTVENGSTFEDSWLLKKKEILENFSQWLDELDELPRATVEHIPRIGLLELFGEMTALRQEVKLHNKSNQNIAVKLSQITDGLHDKLDRVSDLRSVIEDLKSQIPQARQAARKEVLLELLPVIEGLERSLETLKKNTLPTFLFGDSREKHKRNFVEPVTIVQHKAIDSLARLQVESVTSVGAEFCADTMRAVGTTSGSGQISGKVSEILRQGYTLRGVLLQTAEVKVEK